MAFKLIAIFALAAIASAAPIEEYQHEQYVAAPVQHQVVAAPVQHQYVAAPVQHQIVATAPAYKHVEYENAPAQYEFNYEVHDEHTGDIKSQKETRNGDNVQGYYTIVDADGYRRIVEYTADEHHGFNAVVRREPIEGFKAPVTQYKQQPEHSNYHY